MGANQQGCHALQRLQDPGSAARPSPKRQDGVWSVRPVNFLAIDGDDRLAQGSSSILGEADRLSSHRCSSGRLQGARYEHIIPETAFASYQRQSKMLVPRLAGRQLRSCFRGAICSGAAPRQWASPALLLSSSSRRAYSSAAAADQKKKTIEVNGQTITTDEWFNVPKTVLDAASRKLHLQKDHPVYITRQIIESQFPAPTYKYHNTFDPVVSTHQNFDSLGFPLDHPGRAKSDTYYFNKETLLRTHTSAHQAQTFKKNLSEGYLISADVYRRDAIDRSHYPVFHQMEGARMWDRTKMPNGDVAAAVWEDVNKLPKHGVKVEDPHPAFDAERNPLQDGHHSAAEAEAIGAHLKRSLELMVVEIFTRAKAAAGKADPDYKDEPLRVRWVEAYFPFTSPSWELEVYYAGDWLEVLGCGVVKQDICINAGVPNQLGWAFGIGLERIAMLLFQIPDIRLFWSQDERFLGQFRGVSDKLDTMKRFVPFSKHPACHKDVSFWLRGVSAAGGNTKASAQDFHENDIMELVRDIAGERVEDVRLVDEFTHPKTGRRSMCYRINYRSLERTLTNEETNELHNEVTRKLVEKLGVEIR